MIGIFNLSDNHWIKCSDLNVLDLGFFNSIQLLYEVSPNTIDELIKCIQDIFNKLKRNTLDNVFYNIINVYGIN